MPIVQIIAAPDTAPLIVKAQSALLPQVTEALLTHLQPAPETIQICVQAALVPPVGCDTLCLVHHRGSEKRSAEMRATCAKALHDLLYAVTARDVRVRLIALEPQDIAACDTSGGAS